MKGRESSPLPFSHQGQISSPLFTTNNDILSSTASLPVSTSALGTGEALNTADLHHLLPPSALPSYLVSDTGSLDNVQKHFIRIAFCKFSHGEHPPDPTNMLEMFNLEAFEYNMLNSNFIPSYKITRSQKYFSLLSRSRQWFHLQCPNSLAGKIAQKAF